MEKRQFSMQHWDRAIVALLQHRTLKGAAEALGVHRTTLWRLSQNPDFRRRLSLALGLAVSAAWARLGAQSDSAVELLTQVLHDPKQSMAQRTGVAKFILKQRPMGLLLDDLQLEDFEQDSPGLDQEIPTGAELNSEGQVSEASLMIGTTEELEKKLLAASPEQLAFLQEFLEQVVADRRQRARNDSAGSLRGTDSGVHSSVNTASSNADLNKSAHPGPPAGSGAEVNKPVNPGPAAGPRAEPNKAVKPARPADSIIEDWRQVQISQEWKARNT